MAEYFNSSDISIYPTAYRQYTNDGSTTVVDIESRLNTEYNITNLVNGLLDQDINKGNFVIGWDGTTLKFCMNGYYVELRNASSYTNLYVKIYIVDTMPSSEDYHNMKELVPSTFNSVNNASRCLDDGTHFLGIDYVTKETDGYFPLLVNGVIPEQSKLKFSTNQIGYEDSNGKWQSIGTKFETNELITPHILDNDTKLAISGVNDDTQTNLAIVVNASGEIESKDLSNTKTTSVNVFTFMDGITTDTQGMLSSISEKSIPIDTNELTDSDEKLPTSKLVKSNVDRIDGVVGDLSTRVGTNESSIATLSSEKVSKSDLTFSFANGILTINKRY